MGKKRLCCCVVIVFLSLVLLIAAQVSIIPEKLVVAEGDNTAFSCILPSSAEAEALEWLINDILLNDDHRRDGVTQEHYVQLKFRNALTEYNNTRIQCRVGSEVLPTPSLLFVQGPPAAVKSLEVIDGVDNVTVRWTAPFTLDIPRVDPDISGYCVTVVSSTSSAPPHSECGITETELTYSLPPRSWCHEYNFSVTPVNVVGNGTTRSILFSNELEGPEVIGVISTNTKFTLNMSAPVCSAKLTFNDTVDGSGITLENTDLTITESNFSDGSGVTLENLTITKYTITFSSQPLAPNRKYEMRVFAKNIRNNATSSTQISTHDIRNCSLVRETEYVTIFVTFTEDSEATGAMLNFVYINNDGTTIDFTKSLCLTAKKNSVSRGLVLPLNMWYTGQYMFYVYDIESNKKIMNGLQYQASDCNFTAEGGQGTPPPQNQSCNVSSSGGMISVECSSLESFQVTAQINSMEKANILHVNTSMDPHTPVTLQVTENGEYLLVVLSIEGSGIFDGVVFSEVHMVDDALQGSTATIPVSATSEPKSERSTLAIPLAVVAVVLVTVVAIAVVVVVLLSRKHKIAANPNPQPSTASKHSAENAYITVTGLEVPPQIPHASSIGPTTPELDEPQNTGQPASHATVNPQTTSQHENETGSSFSVEHTSSAHQLHVSEESPNISASGEVPTGSLAGDRPTPPHSTLLSDEEQSKSSGSNYVAVASNKPSTKPAASIHDCEYSTPTGYKNQHGQNYVFVDPKRKGGAHEFSVEDDVMYSKLIHQGPSQEEKKGIQGDRSSMSKWHAEDTPFEHGAVQSFRAAADAELPSTHNQLRHRHTNVG